MSAERPSPQHTAGPARDATEHEPLEPTGERLLPDAEDGSLVLAEHLVRYRLAAHLARGRSVLDVACGEGYGSAMLQAAGARSVVGIDLDSAAVAHARRRHGVDAREGDIAMLPFDDDTFELAVSFETIEHVADPQRALDELRRVLAPGGVLVASTPNCNEYLENNPFHLVELTLDEFAAALSARFEHVEMRYQQTFLTTAVLGEPALRSDDCDERLSVAFTKLVAVAPERALYGVAACSDEPIPDLGADVAIASDIHEAHRQDEHTRAWIERALFDERLAEDARRTSEHHALRAAVAEGRADSLERMLAGMKRSISWRVTRPLRGVKALVRGARRSGG